MMLPSLRRRGARSIALLATVLSTFVLGTNYCVLAAMTLDAPGSRPVCHADAASPATTGHGCCAGPESQKTPDSRPAAGFPCCIQVAPPSSPDLAKPELDSGWIAALDATLEIACLEPALPLDLALRSAPPPETFPDLLRGRAPPLS